MTTAFNIFLLGFAEHKSPLSKLAHDPLFDNNLLKSIWKMTRQKFLILAAAPDDRLKDVQHGVLNVCEADMHIMNASTTTPSYDELLRYDSILTWSFHSYQNPETLGDLLTRYQQSGRGGLVVSGYTFSDKRPALQLGGQYREQKISPMDLGSFQDARFENSLPNRSLKKESNLKTLFSRQVVKDARNLILDKVEQFDGGLGSIRIVCDKSDGAHTVCTWDDDIPLVTVKKVPCKESGRFISTVALNFYPASSRVNENFWDANTDGFQLISNALHYATNAIWLMDLEYIIF